jgi:hypothetical protein
LPLIDGDDRLKTVGVEVTKMKLHTALPVLPSNAVISPVPETTYNFPSAPIAADATTGAPRKYIQTTIPVTLSIAYIFVSKDPTYSVPLAYTGVAEIVEPVENLHSIIDVVRLMQNTSPSELAKNSPVPSVDTITEDMLATSNDTVLQISVLDVALSWYKYPFCVAKYSEPFGVRVGGATSNRRPPIAYSG